MKSCLITICALGLLLCAVSVNAGNMSEACQTAHNHLEECMKTNSEEDCKKQYANEMQAACGTFGGLSGVSSVSTCGRCHDPL